jgi:putative cell wall-binding protein
MQKLLTQGARRAALFLLALVLAFSVLVPPMHASAAQTYRAGDEVQVTVSLSSNPATANWLNFALYYDPDVFDFVDFAWADDGSFAQRIEDSYQNSSEEMVDAYSSDPDRRLIPRNIQIRYAIDTYFTSSDLQVGTYTFKVRSMNRVGLKTVPEGAYTVFDMHTSYSRLSYAEYRKSIRPNTVPLTSTYSPLMVLTGNSIEIGTPSTGPEPPPFEVACGYGGDYEYDSNADTLTFAPIEGYALDVLYVDGVPYDTEGVYGTASYELDVSDEDFDETVSIVATFAHTINFTQPSNGLLSVARSNTTLGTDEELSSGDIVRDGEFLTITATPEEDYELTEDGLETTGLELVEDNTYRVLAPRGQGDEPPTLVSASAEFEPAVERYDITVDEGIANGTVTPDRVLAAAGTFVAVTAEPNEGYELSELSYTADGDDEPTPIERGGFFMPEGPVTIGAVFTELAEADTEISTAEQMVAFRDMVNYGEDYAGKVVRLTDDIDLSVYPVWLPIGQQIKHTPENPYGPPEYHYNAFKGSFDGAGHTVTLGIDMDPYEQLYRNSDQVLEGEMVYTYQYAGLFGYVEGAEIQNLTVDGSIKLHAQSGISSSYLGAVVAQAYETIVLDCTSYVNLTVTGSNVGRVGGVVGQASGLLTGCSNYGRIEVPKGFFSLGGVAGSVFDGNITDCMNVGELVSPDTLSGGTHTGGVVGYVQGNNQNIVSGCYNAGEVSATSTNISGIANSQGVNITDCYNTGAIRCTRMSKGGDISVAIAGVAVAIDTTGSVSIDSCYNIGVLSKVEGTDLSCAMGDIAVGQYGLGRYTLTHCYAQEDSFTAANLSASFKDDTNNINGGYPLLVWQSSATMEETYHIAFVVNMPESSEANPTVTVYSDAAHTKTLTPEPDGFWSLTKATNIASVTYYYTVSAEGCMPKDESFNLGYTDLTLSPVLRAAAIVTLTIAPTDANLALTGSSGTVDPTSTAGGIRTYTLYAGDIYNYTAGRSGYNSTTREFSAVDGANIPVALTPVATYDKTVIPSAQGVTITEGGSYRVTKASGFIILATTDPVTLIGTGSSTNDVYTNLFIDCMVAGVDLTLQDISISNNDSSAVNTRSMLSFIGNAEGEPEDTANTLRFKGTVILDWAMGTDNYAMVHVAPDVALTIQGDADAELYLNKRVRVPNLSHAAGIGGNVSEHNGEITFAGGTVFARSTRAGTLIGSGAGATAGNPAPIIIAAGTLNLINASVGTALGGATGSEVIIHPEAALNIDVDSSGAAMGGTTLTYLGGSVRSYVGYNATDPNGDGDASDTLWEGITAPGISDTPITADKVDGAGNPLSLLSFDTALLQTGASEFEAYLDGGTEALYSGALHRYGSINADRPPALQLAIAYTMDNWAPLNDTSLYLYATAANHSLTVNGEDFKAYWAGEVAGLSESGITGSFLVTAEGSARDTLAAAIAEAEELLATVERAADGNRTEPENTWALPEVWDSYSEAITEAWQAALDGSMNDPALQGAASTLAGATSTFNDASEPGTYKGSVAGLTAGGIAQAGYVYTAAPITPKPILTDGAYTLREGTDYTLAYAPNINAGPATITITGTGAWDGELAIPFTINPAPLTITVDAKTKYLGSPDPVYSYFAVGLKAPDRLTGLTLTRTPGETVGSYDITARGAVITNGNTNVSANYAPNYVKATLTILPLLESSWPRLDGGKTEGGRYDTMQAIVNEGWTSSTYVIVASGANFPDALAASSLAGIYGAPVLLTESTTLSPQAEETIRSLGATKAFLIGGEAALSPATFAALEAMLGEGKVARISGGDRIATSLDIYEKGRSPEGANLSWGGTAIIANGFSFADALSVSPFAHATRSPIFLSSLEAGLDEATLGAITTGGFKKVVITGGAAAVPAFVEAQLASTGVSIERWSGASRYETSVDIVKHSLADSGGLLTLNNLVCATGDNYPDALAGGAFAGHTGTVLLLVHATEKSGLAGLELISEHKDEIGKGYVLGGPAAVPEELLKTLEGGSQGH